MGFGIKGEGQGLGVGDAGGGDGECGVDGDMLIHAGIDESGIERDYLAVEREAGCSVVFGEYLSYRKDGLHVQQISIQPILVWFLLNSQKSQLKSPRV